MHRSGVMRITVPLIVLFAGLLSGCTAPYLPSMQGGLRSVNTGPGGVSDFRRGAGTPPEIAATGAPEVCDRAAFETGFKTQYVRHWNWAVHDKEVLYRVKSRQHPGDAAARANYALYRGKLISGQETAAGAGNYGLELDLRGNIRNDCQARSFTQGETAGMRAAGQDIGKLARQER